MDLPETYNLKQNRDYMKMMNLADEWWKGKHDY